MGDIDWALVVGGLGLLVAAASSGVAIWAVIESRRARQASERAAIAAERSAHADERLLELEEAAALANQPPDVTWELRRLNQQRFLLRNTGVGTATNVTVEPGNLPDVTSEVPAAETFGPNEAREFFMLETSNSFMPAQIYVTWDGALSPCAVPVPPE